jgi:hypothetical protein
MSMVIVSLGRLDLGNNYSMDRYIDALSATQVDRIYAKEWELDSDVRLIARGNYGTVRLNTCGNDLSDYLRHWHQNYACVTDANFTNPIRPL